MTFWVAGAVVGSAVIGANASSKAAKSQAAATGQAADLEREMFERNIELNAPFREAGITALNKLVPLATEYTPFGMGQFQADPGYAFRMSEGMKGLERSAAARGGLLSGGTLKGIQRFGQDLASQEYQNAFNRYGVERERRLNPLQSLAGVGQTTSQQLGQAGTQMAGNVGNLMTSGAAARASGYVGGANALTGALNTGLNYYQGQQYLNALRPPAAQTQYPSYQVPYTSNIG
ncbi:DNA transfer protein [Phage DSL-LC05]|nr:DNA transfer protein [Phage DSL-LC05]